MTMHGLTVACAVGAVLLAVCALACAALPILASLADRWRAAGRSKWLVAPLVASLAYVGSTKTGSVTYPAASPDSRYLTDAGSYVTNDAVYVSFTRTLAPLDAPFYIDARQVGETNADRWASVYVGTFATFPNPSFVAYPAATNYDFVCYTTWTPGPVVHTNGVVEIKWKRDANGGGGIVPIRTGVYLDARKITPEFTTKED